jgi:hypothetical protein
MATQYMYITYIDGLKKMPFPDAQTLLKAFRPLQSGT